MSSNRKPACYQTGSDKSLSKRRWSDYFNEIAEEYRNGNCTCGCCVAEAIKKSEKADKQKPDTIACSSTDSREQILRAYSFEKDEGPAVCTCIFCSTYSYEEPHEEVLKNQVTKLGKENIPACKARMLHPERKFFRYASLREKRLARAKNEQLNCSDADCLDDTSGWCVD